MPQPFILDVTNRRLLQRLSSLHEQKLPSLSQDDLFTFDIAFVTETGNVGSPTTALTGLLTGNLTIEYLGNVIASSILSISGSHGSGQIDLTLDAISALFIGNNTKLAVRVTVSISVDEIIHVVQIAALSQDTALYRAMHPAPHPDGEITFVDSNTVEWSFV